MTKYLKVTTSLKQNISIPIKILIKTVAIPFTTKKNIL